VSLEGVGNWAIGRWTVDGAVSLGGKRYWLDGRRYAHGRRAPKRARERHSIEKKSKKRSYQKQNRNR